MRVSMNVPSIDTSPCETGSSTWADAAAIGAEPRPASFEKIPLATPFCIAATICESANPAAPPAMALSPNADLKMTWKASGILVAFIRSTESPRKT